MSCTGSGSALTSQRSTDLWGICFVVWSLLMLSRSSEQPKAACRYALRSKVIFPGTLAWPFHIELAFGVLALTSSLCASPKLSTAEMFGSDVPIFYVWWVWPFHSHYWESAVCLTNWFTVNPGKWSSSSTDHCCLKHIKSLHVNVVGRYVGRSIYQHAWYELIFYSFCAINANMRTDTYSTGLVLCLVK